MSSKPTDEQLEVRRRGRQRLVGAVAIALAAVVFVPMLLDPEPRRSRIEPVLAIPAKDAAQHPGATRPAMPAPSPGASATATVPAASPAPHAVQPATEARKSVEPKAAEFKAPAKAPAPASAAAPKLEGFAVQVGAFKEEAKLAQAREKLATARLAHYTERLGSGAGELTRLRAGPFPTREAAERAAAQLKLEGLDAQVVPLP